MDSFVNAMHIAVEESQTCGMHKLRHPVMSSRGAPVGRAVGILKQFAGLERSLCSRRLQARNGLPRHLAIPLKWGSLFSGSEVLPPSSHLPAFDYGVDMPPADSSAPKCVETFGLHSRQ